MPEQLTHAQIEARLEALFLGDDLKDALGVREHLRHCSRCRAAFEALDQAERLLGCLDEEDPPMAEGFAARYSAQVLRASLQEPPRRASPRLQRLRQAWRRHGRSAALGLAAAALGAMVWQGAQLWHSPAPEPQARAGRATPDAARAGVWQVEAFCVRAQEGAAPTFFAADVDSGELRCALTDELKFAYLNQATRGPALPYLTILSFPEGGGLRWYSPLEPVSDATASMAVPQRDRLSPLGQTLRLALRHRPGPETLYGVFSEHPLPRAHWEALPPERRHEALTWSQGADGRRAPTVVRPLRLSLQEKP